MAASTEGERLVDRILPARGAAKKASASLAEQLTDSPGRPDGDAPSSSSSSSNPFREPAYRTTSVKYRYTATGKHLSSPLKGSSSSPDRKSEKLKQSTLATHTPAPPSHGDKGKTHAIATTSRKRKASAASLHREDLLNAMFISSPSPLSSAPTSPALSARDLSPSTSLAAKESLPDSIKRHPVSKTLSLHSLAPAASKFSVFSQPLSAAKRKQTKSKPHAQKGDHAWDIGNSVWVLVNQSGILADNAQLRSELDVAEHLMWWPAQVVQKQPLRVSMFGDFPSSSPTNRGLCTIFTPSSSNVQSINGDSGTKRFSRATFRLTSLSADDDAAGPPTKKQRLDDIESFDSRWESAVQNMDKASTLERDGLPALLSSYATDGGTFYDSDPDTSDLRQLHKPASSRKSKQTGSARKLKSQRSKESLKVDVNWSTPRQWSPCPPDPTLQIPGELVLALAPRTGASYWPAQILEHVPDRKEKYKLKFLDEEIHVIARDRFWTSEEEGFIRCTLGEWESAIKTIEDLESGDEDAEFGVDGANAQDLDESILPPPPPAGDFEDLSVRVQLAYVKPVLRAILNNQYAPAREKHEVFMKGGSGRAALLKSAGVRGGMDARFVKTVQKVICEWVLGDSGVKPEKLDTEDIATGNGEVAGGAIPKDALPLIMPSGVLPCDPVQGNQMEGIEGAAMPQDSRGGQNDGYALPLTTSEKQSGVVQVAEMTVDGHEQGRASLPSPANDVLLSPAVKQAALAPKSQLDLLAEVSQAVATEPSLLPFRPEVPSLKVHILDIPDKDTSSQASPLTPIPDEAQSLLFRKPDPVVSQEFETLTSIEKLDYCLNVLLPESIQQLLLWHSGERTSHSLLPSEEEQRLHDVSVRRAAETDWVDDVMRLRAAQTRLRGIDPNKKAENKETEAMQGGTRSRPRRGTVSRP